MNLHYAASVSPSSGQLSWTFSLITTQASGLCPSLQKMGASAVLCYLTRIQAFRRLPSSDHDLRQKPWKFTYQLTCRDVGAEKCMLYQFRLILGDTAEERIENVMVIPITGEKFTIV
jgi:hypothetical protein